MEISTSQTTNQSSFRQVLTEDNRVPQSSTQDLLTGGTFEQELTPSNLD